VLFVVLLELPVLLHCALAVQVFVLQHLDDLEPVCTILGGDRVYLEALRELLDPVHHQLRWVGCSCRRRWRRLV
jgi:hypothetical protein